MELALAAYLPVPHASQLSLPFKLWDRPTSQSSHSLWPVLPCALPASQSLQVAELAFAAYLPVPHASQLSLPFLLWCRPTSQSSHSLCPVPPCALPGRQRVQFRSPTAGACDPASQAMQVAAPSSGDANPTVQLSQSLWPVAPCALPVGQSVHPMDPSIAATFPAPHDSQLP